MRSRVPTQAVIILFEFIPLLGGAAVYPPPAARAQQLERTVLLRALVENDPEAQIPVVAFRPGIEASRLPAP
jgi:hypothetical protein